VPTAVEVELTPKGDTRMRRIVDDLAVDHDAVVYVVRGERLRATVERALDRFAWAWRAVVDVDRFALPASR
jgi:hypothetical protein